MASEDIQIKICGLRSANAAIVASDAGATHLGFNFIERVRRQVSPEDGAQIIADYMSGRKSLNRPHLVGLFRDQDSEFVNETARNAKLDYLQLCGDEDADYISKIDLPIIKMIFVKEASTKSSLTKIVDPLLDEGHGVILDSGVKSSQGGSGTSFNWALAEGIVDRPNVFLAGGLNPENVQSAIKQLSPWGVDVASGVETDGVKDPERIKAFISAARSA
jgi:phosphoribosylanthranilate isomerase